MKGTVEVRTRLDWRNVTDTLTDGDLVGFVDFTYDELCDNFGLPVEHHNPAKVEAEWIFRFETGDEFWIYDYKNEQVLEDRKLWCVGGSRKAANWLLGSLGRNLHSTRY